MHQKVKALSLAVAASVVALSAHADSLSHYGALGLNSGTDFPFAADYDDGTVFNADYGMALSYGLIYKKDQGFLGGRPMEFGLELGVLKGDDSKGHELISDCDGGVDTYLGLIDDCQDRADIENLTYWLDASAMVNLAPAGGASDFLAGLGVLAFSNNLDADYLYPLGYENFVSRDTSFLGAGVKVGARHRMPLQNGTVFTLAGFAGAYRGEREMKIHDYETYVGGFNSEDSLTVKSTETVFTLEIRPSITMDAAWAGQGATMEFGLSYKHFFNVVDQTGYGDHEGTDFGGSTDGDVSATSAFFGVTIPM